MLRTTATTMLSAAALLVLGGCTITTYSSNPPPSQATQTTKSAQSKPAPAPGKRRIFQSAKPRTRRASSELAPTITSTIAFGNGTGGAFRGQAYVIPDTTEKLPDFTDMVPFATLYTDSFNVNQREFVGGFPGALVQEDWFAIRYEGKFTVAKDGGVQFKVVSDDGAILYIDGEKVVDNDGKHTSKTVTARKDLKAGTHGLRLDYFQAQKGPVALQVFTVEGTKDTLLVGTK